MKAVNKIAGTVTKIDSDGNVTEEAMSWQMMPAAPGKCKICAVGHKPEDPHNAQSLPYQMAFQGIVGRAPTWADALAHCTDEIKESWKSELKRLGVWSEPPNGEEPVKHHGVE